LTQTDLANLIGAFREDASEQLKTLKGLGILKNTLPQYPVD
jgi:DNA-binding Lrp family transcriptional regulator